MKTSIYFTSTEFNLWEVEKAIAAAKSKKDNWLTANVNSIGDVDGEEIFFHYNGSQNEKVYVTIKLNYYPKEK